MLTNGARIGVTGGIACGKTTVTEIFRKLGAVVVDADQISRELTALGQPVLVVLQNVFGDEILAQNGALDRGALRRIVFENSRAREQLEALLHPRILARMIAQVERTLRDGHAYCLLSIPLLVEKRLFSLVDRVLVVDCEPETQRARLRQRDGLESARIEQILAAQTDRCTRLGYADDVLYNEATRDDLQQQIEKLHRYYGQFGR